MQFYLASCKRCIDNTFKSFVNLSCSHLLDYKIDTRFFTNFIYKIRLEGEKKQ